MAAKRIGTVALLMLALVGCSRASLLGGPGPEVVHHAVPAPSERLAVLEAKREFDSKADCKAHLATLADGAELVEVSAKEVRAYHSEAGVHHEYSCADRQLLERSWRSDDPDQSAGHGTDGHADEVAPEANPASMTKA